MSTPDEAFDDATFERLTPVVEKTWDALPPERRNATSKHEIARLVMLIAISGVLDPEQIMQSIISNAARELNDDE